MTAASVTSLSGFPSGTVQTNLLPLVSQEGARSESPSRIESNPRALAAKARDRKAVHKFQPSLSRTLESWHRAAEIPYGSKPDVLLVRHGHLGRAFYCCVPNDRNTDFQAIDRTDQNGSAASPRAEKVAETRLVAGVSTKAPRPLWRRSTHTEIGDCSSTAD